MTWYQSTIFFSTNSCYNLKRKKTRLATSIPLNLLLPHLQNPNCHLSQSNKIVAAAFFNIQNPNRPSLQIKLHHADHVIMPYCAPKTLCRAMLCIQIKLHPIISLPSVVFPQDLSPDHCYTLNPLCDDSRCSKSTGHLLLCLQETCRSFLCLLQALLPLFISSTSPTILADLSSTVIHLRQPYSMPSFALATPSPAPCFPSQ